MTLHPRQKDRRRVSIKKWPKTMTEQHHKADVNAPAIVARYKRTGVWDHVAREAATYVDATKALNYEQAMNAVADYSSQFERLPPNVRAAFDFDPAKFLDASTDPSQAEKLSALGFDVGYLDRPGDDRGDNAPLPDDGTTVTDVTETQPET